MTTLKFSTPLEKKEVRRVRIGDILYLSGRVITARDEAHKRALEYLQEHKKIPLKFHGLAIYHCGPLVKKLNGKWKVMAAGPTTSMRMEQYEAEMIEKLKPSLIIGKGGMGKRTSDAAKKHGVIYCDFTGGAAVLAAMAIEDVEGVEWLDLGMPEAMWIFKVKNFGPLVVTIDSLGENLHEKLTREVEAREATILN